MKNKFNHLARQMQGEIYFDDTPLHQVQLVSYSTDASVYQEKPLAVAIPKNDDDLKWLVNFARAEKVTLIPRAAGTSLAGQVVGNGIVVDMSKHFKEIVELNTAEKWVRVQPGMIRDDLNKKLAVHGLMFGPETSTSSRAMIGGMVGNNSSGLHSIVWGDTRTNLLEVEAILSDGSEVIFCEEDIAANKHSGFKAEIYKGITSLLQEEKNQAIIRRHFPKPSVKRRNTGYALDSLLPMKPFSADGIPFNLCKLIAGSEGTLLLIKAVKLQLIDLPPKQTALVCVHCDSIDHALRANIIALRHQPMASELVDRYIMNFTRQHPEYRKNCFFVEGDPAAILMIEFMADSKEDVEKYAARLIDDLKLSGFGYAFPVLYNQDTKFAWEVRKAGLGLLRNEPSDVQPVNLIEDCAVDTDELPDYIRDLQAMLDKYKVTASYYAHAGAGELHVEPMINLRTKEGLILFRTILAETVELVRKYNGSLSGEHGDGRLRGEYIPALMGEETFELFREIKKIFDPHGIFNKGKIVDTLPMDQDLRINSQTKRARLKTNFNFSVPDGLTRMAEKCSGSGDCRKTELTGGTMCPSFMATRNEKDSTRARANVLRKFLTDPHDNDPLNHHEIKEVMDLCLSCKACKTECPSAVDVTKMKAEFLQHYYDRNGIPFRTKLIGNFSKQMKLASKFRTIYNFIFRHYFLRSVANRLIGFHPRRSIPLLPKTDLKTWYTKRKKNLTGTGKRLYFFCDEFTNYSDAETGKKAILLLEALGYEVVIPGHLESGRTWLSKGLVRKAVAIANRNVELLSPIISAEAPLIGIEPSAILSFRDEYPDLVSDANRDAALALSKHVYTIEEFMAGAMARGEISKQYFTNEKKLIAVHGHCYQKTLSSQHFSDEMLSLPENYTVQIIPSGCCGMAGSFGYEKEHYDVSQAIGELVLFPTVRKLPEDVLVAAAGTSCRHQVKDGTARQIFHPAEILFDALLNKHELEKQL